MLRSLSRMKPCRFHVCNLTASSGSLSKSAEKVHSKANRKFSMVQKAQGHWHRNKIQTCEKKARQEGRQKEAWHQARGVVRSKSRRCAVPDPRMFSRTTSQPMVVTRKPAHFPKGVPCMPSNPRSLLTLLAPEAASPAAPSADTQAATPVVTSTASKAYQRSFIHSLYNIAFSICLNLK